MPAGVISSTGCIAFLVSGLLDRLDDAVVRTAAAEVTAHPFADLVRRLRMSLFEQRDAGHDLPRSAVATLQPVVLDHRALQWVHHAVLGDSLDRCDLLAFAAGGQRQAAEHTPPVDMDGACATGALVTSLLRPGQAKALAQDVEQALTRIEDQRVTTAVDGQSHLHERRRA